MRPGLYLYRKMLVWTHAGFYIRADEPEGTTWIHYVVLTGRPSNDPDLVMDGTWRHVAASEVVKFRLILDSRLIELGADHFPDCPRCQDYAFCEEHPRTGLP